MPTGPAGVTRPFTSCELVFQGHYEIDQGYGERLDNPDVQRDSERMIAQYVEDHTGHYDPQVQVAAAGSSVTVTVGLGSAEITSGDKGQFSIGKLEQTCMEAAKQMLDENAHYNPERMNWSITAK